MPNFSPIGTRRTSSNRRTSSRSFLACLRRCCKSSWPPPGEPSLRALQGRFRLGPASKLHERASVGERRLDILLLRLCSGDGFCLLPTILRSAGRTVLLIPERGRAAADQE